jgi:hypothetical protein
MSHLQFTHFITHIVVALFRKKQGVVYIWKKMWHVRNFDIELTHHQILIKRQLCLLPKVFKNCTSKASKLVHFPWAPATIVCSV